MPAAKDSRVGRCDMCGMPMLVKRSDCKTCSTKCRKRLQRKSHLEMARGEPMIRIDGIAYPARLVEMFAAQGTTIQAELERIAE